MMSKEKENCDYPRCLLCLSPDEIRNHFREDISDLITACLDIQFANSTFEEVERLREQIIEKWTRW